MSEATTMTRRVNRRRVTLTWKSGHIDCAAQQTRRLLNGRPGWVCLAEWYSAEGPVVRCREVCDGEVQSEQDAIARTEILASLLESAGRDM